LNFALCNKCRQTVPVENQRRGNRVYLVKKCVSCGDTETLISNDAEAYYRKRAFVGDRTYPTCKLDCTVCNHIVPNIAFIELTNRCNMNCPICITNVPSMGFEFEPGMEYFRTLFETLAKLDPKPSLQLFGGEPTVREDLFEIIRLARSHDLSVRVVTNGLKLADPEYCERLMAEDVSILISFDGFDRKVYEKFRGSGHYLDLKVRALENLAKGKRGKVILMTVASREQDPSELKRLFEYCMKTPRLSRGIFLMPLAHMWSPDRLDYSPERTTPEDVERMVGEAVGGEVEFVPLGSLETDTLNRVLKLKSMPFVGVHPNCESLTLLISDGERYLSANTFLKRGFAAAVADLRALAGALEKTREGFSRKRKAWCGLARLVLRHFDFGAAVGRKGLGAFLAWAGIFARMALGRKPKLVLRERTRLKGLLQIIVLPFEDYDTTEGTRLRMCKSCFAFPEGKNGPVRYIPVCAWERHKAEVMRRVAETFNKPGFTKGLSGEKNERVAENV